MADSSSDGLLLDPTSPEDLDVRRVAAFLDAAGDAFFDLDLARGTIRWSHAVTLLFGHEPARLGGDLAAWKPFIHPDDVASVAASARAIKGSSATAWSAEFRLARSDGTYAPVRARAFPVRSHPDHGIHLVGAVSDLSQLRELEAELRATASQLVTETGAADLTERQHQVLSLVRLGHTNKEIGARLGISEQAAKVQVRKLMRRFGAANRAALAAARYVPAAAVLLSELR